MGYESEPLPSYQDLRNCSYSIKLSYTTYLSTPQVRLPRPGPTISTSDLSPSSALPTFRAHRWVGRPLFPLWFPAASWCIPLWGGSLRLPVPPLPIGATTLRLPQVSLSAPWSDVPPGGGTPPVPWASTLSPTSSFYRTRSPTAPLPYTYLPGPAPLCLSFPEPYLPFPTASDIFSDFGIPLSNHCYCRQFSGLGTRKPPTVAGPLCYS